MSVLPLVFTSGWASGVNAYAVVLLLGIFGATGLSDDVPEALQRPDVLIAAGVLFLCEAVADKIPYVDSAWDAAHTVIRPVSGAVVAALLAGQSGSVPELAAGAVGGSTALVRNERGVCDAEIVTRPSSMLGFPPSVISIVPLGSVTASAR